MSYSKGQYQEDFLRFKTLPEPGAPYKDFQIISLIADASELSTFLRQNPDLGRYPIASLQSHQKAAALNGGAGMPSCVLVDRYGRIGPISLLGGRLFDEQAMSDKIRELILQ
jgi:hypothetical protein